MAYWPSVITDEHEAEDLFSDGVGVCGADPRCRCYRRKNSPVVLGRRTIGEMMAQAALPGNIIAAIGGWDSYGHKKCFLHTPPGPGRQAQENTK